MLFVIFLMKWKGMKIELTRGLNTTILFQIIKSDPDSGELQKNLARVTVWLKWEVKLNHSKWKIMYVKETKNSLIQRLFLRKIIFTDCNLWKYHVSIQQWYNMCIRLLSGKQQWINRKHTCVYCNPDQETPEPLSAGK